MPMNVNCQHFGYGGHCTHHAAPRKLLGLPQCVVMYPPADPRLMHGCRIALPHTKPDGRPLPPPSLIRREGSERGFTITPVAESDRPAQ